jgi:hypothetical protein
VTDASKFSAALAAGLRSAQDLPPGFYQGRRHGHAGMLNPQGTAHHAPARHNPACCRASHAPLLCCEWRRAAACMLGLMMDALDWTHPSILVVCTATGVMARQSTCIMAMVHTRKLLGTCTHHRPFGSGGTSATTFPSSARYYCTHQVPYLSACAACLLFARCAVDRMRVTGPEPD